MAVSASDDRRVAERDEMRPDRPSHAGGDGQHPEIQERVQLERNRRSDLCARSRPSRSSWAGVMTPSSFQRPSRSSFVIGRIVTGLRAKYRPDQ